MTEGKTIEEIASLITNYENGEMTIEEVVDFFAVLIGQRVIFHLQGTYQRTASDFVQSGFISPDGQVLKYPEELF